MELYFKGKKYDLDNAVIENCIELSKLKTSIILISISGKIDSETLHMVDEKWSKALNEMTQGEFAKNHNGIIAKDNRSNITVLSEIDMNNLGWYRKDTIKDLYKVPSY